MVLEIVLIVVGIAVVLWGADRFTDGACGLARELKVSELVIGLTVVSLGTSLPEFIVSFMSVLRDSSNMSVGNIIGSNVFNILVIIGASAILRNIKVEGSLLHRDLPICFIATFLLFNFALSEGTITRLEGLLLTSYFCLYLYITYRVAMKDRRKKKQALSEGETDQKPAVEGKKPFLSGIWGSLFLIIIGIAALVIGGRVLVDNAAAFAREIGISESVIGMTILAAGTSLPEFATSVIAARKGSFGLALGNAIGSNIFNIAFVIGICSSIVPMAVTEITTIDWAVFVGSTILVWVVSWTGRKLDKKEGILFVVSYLTYLAWLIMH